jgi:hypothetical protein
MPSRYLQRIITLFDRGGASYARYRRETAHLSYNRHVFPFVIKRAGRTLPAPTAGDPIGVADVTCMTVTMPMILSVPGAVPVRPHHSVTRWRTTARLPVHPACRRAFIR